MVFGPHPRSYVQAMPRKMRRLAVCSAISRKMAGKSIVALDSLTMSEFKTREFVKLLENLQITDRVLLAEKCSPADDRGLATRPAWRLTRRWS